MAIAELPPAFQTFKLDAAERRACDLFLAKAHELAADAPGLEVLGPRRTQAGGIKIMLRFPEVDSWDLTTALATTCNEIEDQTGVYFILD